MLCDEDNPTPLVKLNRVTGFKHAELYGKLEWYNPFGSVKDRVAANLIMDAEASGLIDKSTTIVEPTSGNTGLGLIMMANTRGMSLTVPISTRVPEEKRNALKLMGAQLIELDDEL
jgi:cysteine synthase